MSKASIINKQRHAISHDGFEKRTIEIKPESIIVIKKCQQKIPTPDKSLPHMGPIMVLGYMYKPTNEIKIVSTKFKD